MGSSFGLSSGHDTRLCAWDPQPGGQTMILLSPKLPRPDHRWPIRSPRSAGPPGPSIAVTEPRRVQ